MPELRAAVVTVSDACARGEREDKSGPLVSQILSHNGIRAAAQSVVPDEQAQIEAELLMLSAEFDLVVTTGGTGISPRDVTPEATRAVCERFLDGIPERMRAEGLKHTRFAVLSRATCGIRGQCIILNLPGSPEGAKESLEAVIDLLPHALNLLRGNTSHPSNWRSQTNRP